MTGAAMDLNDIDYDAYLANDRTLADPLVVRTERGGRVRLRLINGATTTAFWIDLGALEGTLIAVDGDAVRPVAVRRFPLAQGQRADVLLEPDGGGAFPVLAQREGDRQRTGIILATPQAQIAKVASEADSAAAAVDLSLEARLAAVQPLRAAPAGRRSPHGADRDDDAVCLVDRRPHLARPPAARRVARPARRADHREPQPHGASDASARAPLPGDGSWTARRIAGALRDTVLVPVNGSVTIAFDADNPGRWLLHCHNLFHMATGMMTELAYDNAA